MNTALVLRPGRHKHLAVLNRCIKGTTPTQDNITCQQKSCLRSHTTNVSSCQWRPHLWHLNPDLYTAILRSRMHSTMIAGRISVRPAVIMPFYRKHPRTHIILLFLVPNGDQQCLWPIAANRIKLAYSSSQSLDSLPYPRNIRCNTHRRRYTAKTRNLGLLRTIVEFHWARIKGRT